MPTIAERHLPIRARTHLGESTDCGILFEGRRQMTPEQLAAIERAMEAAARGTSPMASPAAGGCYGTCDGSAACKSCALGQKCYQATRERLKGQ